MMAAPITTIAPRSTPLPAGPTEGPFGEEQWATLMAIMDTIIPSIRRKITTTSLVNELAISDETYKTTTDHLKKTVVGISDDDAIAEYFAESASGIPQFQDLLKRTFAFYVREDARKQLAVILSMLNTRPGALLLTGYVTPFHLQPIHVRQAILLGWRDSYMPPLNAMFKQFSLVAKNVWLKTSPAFQKLSGYPKTDNYYKQGTHFEFEFMQAPAGSTPEVIETDVVIVGSGCGGAVCAKNLAEAGHKVVVVDKGYYFRPEQLPMNEIEGGVHLFENGGLDATEDGSTSVLVGSTWGGGGTINWSASLQPQGFVRREWAQDKGLTFFESAEFQTCLDRVCHRMGVSTDHIRHNHGNEMILEGARKLGYHAKAVPQNTGGAEHFCGRCTLGCGAAEKQGPVSSWLPDAANAGAKFMEGFQVHHVIFDESKGTKTATGVKGTWTSRDSRGGTDAPLSERVVREVIVKAKRVIISCGTIWSPVVLLNSGLKNRQIGRNLHLHPVNVIAGVYEEDVRPWEGGILTTVCTSFENLDGHGHGAKLETSCMLPSWFLTLMNWESGLDFKSQALKFRHTNGFISLARDRDTGRIWVDPLTGRPRIDYTPSAFDRASIMEGNVALAKMCYVTGAREIHAAITGVKPFIRTSPLDSSADSTDAGITDAAFTSWLAELRRIGNKPPTGTYAVAHQMGSNRMSAREKDGVVDPKGKVWGTEGLYVADASIFPSASGVNPMVTNMAISDWISRNIAKDLRTGGVGARL